MKQISNKELLCIIGGASITGTLINSLARSAEIILDVGRSLGSAIRRFSSGRLCSF